jgi:hypothetical protein
MACCSHCALDTIKTGAVRGGTLGRKQFRDEVALRGVLQGAVKLALKILLSDLDIAQSHADVFVSEQLHQCGKADAQAEHFRCVGVAELVTRYSIGTARSFCRCQNGKAEMLIRAPAAGAWQQEVRRLRRPGWGILFAEFQNASDDIPDALINGHQAFGMKLADRYMQSPLVLPDRSQTIFSEVYTLADADSRSTCEQERIGEPVVSATKFLLKALVLIERECSGQALRLRWEIFEEYESGLQMPLGGKVIQQAAKQVQEATACSV